MRGKESCLLKSTSVIQSTGPKLEASPEEVKASRLTPERIAGLRKKLGIFQRELGVLVGATIGAVASWEKGKFKPQGEKKAALVALRRVRKRDVKKILAERADLKDGGKKNKLAVNRKRKNLSKKVRRFGADG